ncbi:MAG: HAD hydrolase-like protein [Rhizobiaceae bacterium]
MPGTPKAVLFDLDGTLTDPFVGISTSMQYALGKMGRPIPLAEELRRYIGPPLQVTLPMLLASDDPASAEQALGHYRERYSGPGKFENELIEGIEDAVKSLIDRGYELFVATSKLESYSVDIVEHFGLMPYFKAVHGSRLDGSNANKADLIRHIIATEGLDPARTVMIGDRLHDVHGAAVNGIKTIGVLWGFGDRAELEEAGAARIAAEPQELPRLIKKLLST